MPKTSSQSSTPPVENKLLEVDSELASQEASISAQLTAIQEKRKSLQTVIHMFSMSGEVVPEGTSLAEVVSAATNGFIPDVTVDLPPAPPEAAPEPEPARKRRTRKSAAVDSGSKAPVSSKASTNIKPAGRTKASTTTKSEPKAKPSPQKAKTEKVSVAPEAPAKTRRGKTTAAKDAPVKATRAKAPVKQAPAVSKAAPKVSKAAPKPSKAASTVSKAAPKVAKTAPKVTKAAPKVTKVAPKVSKAAPKVSKAAPKAEEPSSSKKKMDWQPYVRQQFQDRSLPQAVLTVLEEHPNDVIEVPNIIDAIFVEDIPKPARTSARDRLSNVLSVGLRTKKWYRGKIGQYSVSKEAAEASRAS